MTPQEHFEQLRKTSTAIAELSKAAREKLIQLIGEGWTPAEAVRIVMATFRKEYEKVVGKGLEEATGVAVKDALAYTAGQVTLSNRLYAYSESTSMTVTGLVNKHVKGFANARELAFEIYEGYGFNPEEVINLNKPGDAVPRYMKEALLPDATVRHQLARAYAGAQTKALRTGNLRAAYQELLKAIDKVEEGAGFAYLDKKLKVAFEEKLRYFANRIAQTELHRAFAERQALDIMADEDTKFVRWRLSPMHPVEDICDYFAYRDIGYGPGVYPKEIAPVPPAHPFCKCIMTRDIMRDDEIKPIPEDADQKYFASLPPDVARKVAGSAAKLERIQNGETAWAVHNSNIDAVYQVKMISDVKPNSLPDADL